MGKHSWGMIFEAAAWTVGQMFALVLSSFQQLLHSGNTNGSNRKWSVRLPHALRAFRVPSPKKEDHTFSAWRWPEERAYVLLGFHCRRIQPRSSSLSAPLSQSEVLTMTNFCMRSYIFLVLLATLHVCHTIT